MGQLTDALKSQGYSLRERTNIYAGTIIGAVAPIVALRYSLFSGLDNLPWYIKEPIAWGSSTVASLAPIVGPPLSLISLSVGSILGVASAHNLKNERKTREISKNQDLENLTTN